MMSVPWRWMKPVERATASGDEVLMLNFTHTLSNHLHLKLSFTYTLHTPALTPSLYHTHTHTNTHTHTHTHTHTYTLHTPSHLPSITHTHTDSSHRIVHSSCLLTRPLKLMTGWRYLSGRLYVRIFTHHHTITPSHHHTCSHAC